MEIATARSTHREKINLSFTSDLYDCPDLFDKSTAMQRGRLITNAKKK